MKIDLSGRWRRGCFLVAVALAGAALSFFAGKVWLAEHWNASSQPQLWPKAARLEPGYATYWEHLGLYKQWDVSNGDVHTAVRYLRRATEDDPLSADLWMELADAYQSAGDGARTRQAYEKAGADQPLSSEVAWRYGSFLLFEGKTPQGYAEIRRAVTEDHSLATSAVSECWQANPSVSAILDDVLPAKRDVYLAAMDFFLSQQQVEGAVTVWQRLVALHQPVKLPQAFWLIDSLMNANRVADASAVWREALAASNWPGARGAGQSLVFNGGFENEIANGGFGWREIPVDDARYGIDSSVAHSGARSLRIEFEGKANLDFQNVFQYVSVAPRTRYHFSAYLRTENISTRSGIRFEIFDPHHPSEVQIVTPNMTGTNPWMPVETDFVTGADTDLLEIALRRTPEWRFDNKIQGTVWVDDVALIPEQATSPARAAGGAR